MRLSAGASSVVVILDEHHGDRHSITHGNSFHPFDLFIQTCRSLDLYDNAWRPDKPRTDPIDAYVGALRDGGPVDLFRRDYIGLVISAAAYGFVGTLLPATAAAALANYSSSPLLYMGWGLKLLVAASSDSIACLRYRRKSYMILGWSLVSVTCLALAFFPSASSPDTTTTHIKATLVGLALAGMMVAKVVGDGVLVELSQREPIDTRGHTALALTAVRWLAAATASLVVALAWHMDELGVTWTLDVAIAWHVLALVALVPIPALLFCLRETNVVPACEFRRRFHTFWRLLRNRAMWQLCAFQLVGSCFAAVSATATGYMPLAAVWLPQMARTGHSALALVVFQLLFAGMTLVFKTRGLAWNWRHATTIAATATVFVQSVYLCRATLLTSSSSDNDEWLWFVGSWLQAAPAAVLAILRILPVIEIAHEGYEATTFALVTGFGEFIHPLLASFAQSAVLAPAAATPSVHHVLVVCFGLNAVGFFAIKILPRRRRDCLTLRHYGGYSTFLATMTLALTAAGTVLSFAYGTLTNVTTRS
ncbi:Aste57867_2637 [Aphanomyces stellatus]|uniref:Aste57867_2637 protein n=1 Tax=Aphanomyces stellatus TaxID=120398 RepID=A0A485K7Z3_9STRA|nr:hypothetical protein As57867_002630 [Aphanomyces stellatus]VFT79833.1 Aste57867_2637 [Aphanomyces stellatus]